MFLSPDNYVQFPDFTQNFNRYAYALNNPLKFTDPSGENPVVVLMIGMVIFEVWLTCKMIREMNNNSTLYTIGNIGMLGGSMIMGFAFPAISPIAGIIGNEFIVGFNNAINGGSFERGFLWTAGLDLAVQGLGAIGDIRIGSKDLLTIKGTGWGKKP